MQMRRPLDDVLASRGHVRVLRALDRLPDGVRASARDVARRAGIAHSRVLRILPGLAADHVVTVYRAGRADLYQLDREHVLYKSLHSLFSDEAAVEAQLLSFLRSRLRSAVPRAREAYVFGSVARGEARPGSDLDLALVVPDAPERVVDDALAPVIEEVRSRFGADLNAHVSRLPLSQRRRSRGTGRALWEQIAREGVKVLP